MSNNTGGPAYPTNNWQKTVPLTSGYHEGMTLRDYFAAKAMQAIMMGQYPITKDLNAEDRISVASYQLADAMLKVRQE